MDTQIRAMPVWDDLLNCVCQNGPQRPGVQEVLDTLQRNTVCTGTQCFETEADAFGLTAAPSTVQPNTMFFMMMMFMMLVAVMMKLKKPTPTAAEKPGSSSSHSSQPPPPPTAS
uniref:Small integral membrane protein 14 n=1 Tax=Haptolina brevifila TaxID=156173 RepID=A0A6U7JNY4_9EUKA|mmetsp:Transcript_65280/g.129184  ORF Transcript_65280/g.129184 Transcript_65280/m.129184 type:complete len:114 (+) Transcript_65280:118-459(+)